MFIVVPCFSLFGLVSVWGASHRPWLSRCYHERGGAKLAREQNLQKRSFLRRLGPGSLREVGSRLAICANLLQYLRRSPLRGGAGQGSVVVQCAPSAGGFFVTRDQTVAPNRRGTMLRSRVCSIVNYWVCYPEGWRYSRSKSEFDLDRASSRAVAAESRTVHYKEFIDPQHPKQIEIRVLQLTSTPCRVGR